MIGAWMGGALTGAGATWLFDADNGRRRRALVKDKSQRAWHVLADGVTVGFWDLRHILEGRVAELRAAARHEKVGDRVIRARMRAELGRHVSHPHALEIDVEDGMARLHGPILRSEVDPMLDALLSVRGVRGLENHLEVYEEPGHLPALQGGFERRTRAGWRPAWRLLSGLGGATALASTALAPKGWRWPFVAGGGLMLLRASTNKGLLQLAGIGAGRTLVDLHKSIEIAAPLDQVRGFLSSFENYPLFMEHVRSTEVLPNGHVRWHLAGPARVPLTVETRRVDDGRADCLCWESVGGRPRHQVEIRLFPSETGTRVAVHFAYTPPAGMAGHGLGVVTRTDPRHSLDRDLIRLKSLLEVGKTTLRGQTVVYAQV